MQTLWMIVLALLSSDHRLTPDQLSRWLKEREAGKRSFLLVDVRTPEEHQSGIIPGTDTLIPVEVFATKKRPVPVDPEKDTVVLYCRSGRRAEQAARMLRKQGYRYVFNAGGILQWKEAGKDLVPPDGVVPASRVCMTQDDVYPRDLIPVEVEGETYYGCCPGCAAAIRANPDRFIWARDPVSGERIKKSRAIIYNYRGKALYFASPSSLETFRKNPEAYLRKGEPNP